MSGFNLPLIITVRTWSFDRRYHYLHPLLGDASAEAVAS